MDDKEIILGSGKVYVTEFTGTTIPTDEVLEIDGNLLGLISGGASVEYKPTYYTAKDDLALVSKTIITEEEALFKTGICTLNGDTIGKMCATAKVTETETKRTVKVGGLGNYDDKQYVIRFVHVSGNKRVTIVGQNQSGFTLTFAKDKETIVDAEFKALPNDATGTLIIYEETIAEA